MRRRPCRRSYRPAPENRSRSRSDCSSKNCCHASCVCPYKSPQKLSFISARKCWKCSLIGIIFAIGCRSPFQERLSLVRQSQLTPSRLLHNQRYVTPYILILEERCRLVHDFAQSPSRSAGRRNHISAHRLPVSLTQSATAGGEQGATQDCYPG